MKTVDQIKEIEKFIFEKICTPISCARKNIKDKTVELVFYPLVKCYTVYHGESRLHFPTLKKACEYYDSVS
jgi:hypothetical protein